MKPNNIILECVVGSHLYNLDTPESDEDVKGVYVLPTTELLSSLNGWNKIDKVYDHNDPDWAYYEIQKFMKLVAKGNPTLLELLYADKYTFIDDIGKLLVEHRSCFLSEKAVRKSYLGYAYKQFTRRYRNASDITEYRNGKHCRHIWRLLKQYEQLATTGTLTPRLTDEEREECFAFQEKSYSEVYEWFMEERERLDKLPSVLPPEPDWRALDELLYNIRKVELLHGDDY